MNPAYLPLSGVEIKGYAVRDRIVVEIYNYAAITTFKVSVIGATNDMFGILALDYEATNVPKNTL